MSANYCPKCGTKVSEQALFCTRCGSSLSQYNTNIVIKQKIPGRGFGITAMIMGILGVVYGFTVAFNTVFTLNLSDLILNDNIDVSGFIRFSVFAAAAEIMIFGILALVFAFVSRKRGYINGKNTAAIVMGIINIVLCVLSVVFSAVFYN